MTTFDLRAYFEQQVPERFQAMAASFTPEQLEQGELVVSYTITGEGGAVYSLRLLGSQLEVVPSILETNDLHTTVTIADFAATHVDAWEEPAIDYYARGKVAVIKGLKGTLRYELSRSDDGDEFIATTVFQATPEPEVTLRMTVADYAAMVRGDLNGNMAFMTGKLKFEGSLPLLMQLGALNS
jgi:putative sterol carrier protein